METPRKVKTKLNKIIQSVGNINMVAEKLGIHFTYVYKMLNGVIPGKRLYRDICQLYEEINSKVA